MAPSSPPFSSQVHQGRDLPPSSFGNAGRELPTPSILAKPSSMSISSMLGAEPPKSREISATPNGSASNHPFPPFLHSSASSPTKSIHGHEMHHRSTVEAQSQMPGSLNRFRTYSGGAPPNGAVSVNPESPLHSRFNRHTNGSMTQMSPRSEYDPTQEWRVRPDRRSDPGRFIERPSSQPNGPHALVEEMNRRNIDIDEGHNRDLTHQVSQPEGDQERTSYRFLNKPNHPDSAPATASKFYRSVQHDPPDDRMQTSNYPFLSNKSLFSKSGSRGQRPENDDHEGMEQRPTPMQKGPWGAEALRRIRDERLAQVPNGQAREIPNESRPRFLDTMDHRATPDEHKFSRSSLDMERSASFDRAFQQPRDGEIGHRNSLALVLENNRRAGRLSPLPQAVQGAQGQTHGPSRDPSIKNEFSKMFAGIGSGVSSSGLAGSGASTPYPSSPKQNENEPRLAFSNRNDLMETGTRSGSGSRNGSRMGNKRSRKPKESGGREVDGSSKAEDGNGKGGKRARHHHHVPGHQ